jgi:hypothetical protein
MPFSGASESVSLVRASRTQYQNKKNWLVTVPVFIKGYVRFKNKYERYARTSRTEGNNQKNYNNARFFGLIFCKRKFIIFAE